jgi:hypothetical protein
MVPWALQRAVWSTYQAGQELRLVAPSPAWHDAADAAIHAVWQRENPGHGQRQVRSVDDWQQLRRAATEKT